MINISLFEDKQLLSHIGLVKSFTSQLKYFLFYFNDNLKAFKIYRKSFVNFPYILLEFFFIASRVFLNGIRKPDLYALLNGLV